MKATSKDKSFHSDATVAKNALLLLAAVLQIVGLSSCGNQLQEYPAVLETADSLAYVNPDSAVALLQSVEAEMTASTPAVHHRYDLLTIKARDKANYPLTSESLILDVLDHYEHGGDPNKLPEAYYYAGRVFRPLGDAPQAIDYFQKAQTTLNELDLQKLPAANAERYGKLKGTIMAQKGYVFRNQHLYRESEDCFKQAYILDSLSNDTVGMFMDLNDIGYVKQIAGDNEHALHYFDMAAIMAGEYGDSLYLENIIVQKCQCLNKLKRYDEVAKYLQEFHPHFTRSNSEIINSLFGEYYWKTGESEKAVPYFKWLYDSGSIYSRSNAALWFSDYETKRGNAKEALRYMAEFSNLEIELRKLRNEEVTALTSSLYNYHLREQENQRLKAKQEVQKLRFWMVSLIAFLLVCALFFIIRYARIRQRYLKSNNEHLRYLLSSMQADKEKHQQMIQTQAANLRNSEIHQLIATKCANNECLYNRDWLIVEETMQRLAPEFISKLRSVHSFSPMEWKVSLLTKFGFSPTDMAIATAHTSSAIYSIRSRLNKKVFIHDAPFSDWESFINSL